MHRAGGWKQTNLSASVRAESIQLSEKSQPESFYKNHFGNVSAAASLDPDSLGDLFSRENIKLKPFKETLHLKV